VRRIAAAPLVLAALHLHHHHGVPADYLGIGVAAFISWLGIPGPGEATLIAAGILAAKHRLDLGIVLPAAFAGAAIGGTVGWWTSRHLGRAVMSRPGAFHQARVWAIRQGERYFRRFGILAVYLSPSWVPGILCIRGSYFLPANLVSAVVWAALWGTGAYLVGPAITDIATDVGYVGAAALVLLVLAVIAAAVARRRRAELGTAAGRKRG
jgi:membrane protein DedA with SNARE-associated domain